MLATTHLTALLPHHQIWSGPTEDTHLQGPPLLMASTEGAPFRLVTHVGELGNVLMAGPSRVGQVGLLGLMVRQGFRYPGMRMCLFDRDNALKAVTLLHGGQHYALGSGGQSAAADPGRHRHPRRSSSGRRCGWKTSSPAKGLPPDPEERRELWRTVQMLADLPRHERTLSMARQLLQVTPAQGRPGPLLRGRRV